MARKTKAEAAKTKASLLSAAKTIFSQQGIAEARLQDIAEKAGVTRGALYWHFTNKQDIVNALSEQMQLPMQSVAGKLEDAFNQSPLDTIKHHVGLLFDHIDNNRQLKTTVRLAFHQSGLGERPNTLKVQQVASRIGSVGQIARELEWAKALDQVDKEVNCRAAALGIHGLIDGLLYHWSIDTKAFDSQDAKIAVALYLDGLKKTKLPTIKDN